MTPAYVHHLLDAFLGGTPLDFHGDRPPADVQHRLDEAVAAGRLPAVPAPDLVPPAYPAPAAGGRTDTARGTIMAQIDREAAVLHAALDAGLIADELGDPPPASRYLAGRLGVGGRVDQAEADCG